MLSTVVYCYLSHSGLKCAQMCGRMGLTSGWAAARPRPRNHWGFAAYRGAQPSRTTRPPRVRCGGRPSREMVLHLSDHLETPVVSETACCSPEAMRPSIPSSRMTHGPRRRPAIRSTVSFAPTSRTSCAPRPPLEPAVNQRRIRLAHRRRRARAPGTSANALRLILHPRGIAPRIINLAESSAYLLHRLRRQLSVTRDAVLERLYAELSTYPGVRLEATHSEAVHSEVGLLLRMQDDDHELAVLCTVSTFVTAPDITVTD